MKDNLDRSPISTDYTFGDLRSFIQSNSSTNDLLKFLSGALESGKVSAREFSEQWFDHIRGIYLRTRKDVEYVLGEEDWVDFKVLKKLFDAYKKSSASSGDNASNDDFILPMPINLVCSHYDWKYIYAFLCNIHHENLNHINGIDFKVDTSVTFYGVQIDHIISVLKKMKGKSLKILHFNFLTSVKLMSEIVESQLFEGIEKLVLFSENAAEFGKNPDQFISLKSLEIWSPDFTVTDLDNLINTGILDHITELMLFYILPGHIKALDKSGILDNLEILSDHRGVLSNEVIEKMKEA